MRGTPSPSQAALIASPVLRRCSSLSMTHGPATSSSGAPPPSASSPIRTDLVNAMGFEFRVSGLGNQSSSNYPLPSTLDPKPCLLDPLPSTLDPALLSDQRGLDELPEQRVGPIGTRFELW